MKTKLTVLFLLCWFFSIFFTSSAFAYIDPGTGSMMVQAVIAAVAAAGVFIGLCWHRVKSFFTRAFGKKESTKDD